MRTRLALLSLSVLCGVTVLCRPSAAADELLDRRSSLVVVPAFPELKWSGWSPYLKDGQQQVFRPVALVNAGDGTNRLFVVTQRGVIHAFQNHPKPQETTRFLDYRAKTEYQDKQFERGLLGLAFHPQFKENGQFFIVYTTTGKSFDWVLSRMRVKPGIPQRADPDSEEQLLRFRQPFWNHNSGNLAFGPDGYLYVGIGDGGSANDPLKNGQNLTTLFGTILRIDVDRQSDRLPYAIPASNPWADHPEARKEIYAYGLRNVWGMAFDRKTQRFWAADVGQDRFEEVNIIRPGRNYGWNLREGRHPFGEDGVGLRDDLTEPVWEYDHSLGVSITGGTVYRGRQLSELQGRYLCGDFVSGRLWVLTYDEGQDTVVDHQLLDAKLPSLTSFGEDELGELYLTKVDPTGQSIYRLERVAP